MTRHIAEHRPSHGAFTRPASDEPESERAHASVEGGVGSSAGRTSWLRLSETTLHITFCGMTAVSAWPPNVAYLEANT
jgi:hypothetical protein